METITVQVYPDDNKINKIMNAASCVGWKVLSNQRCQEREGTTISTFNKLTLQREKNPKLTKEYSELELITEIESHIYLFDLNLGSKPDKSKIPQPHKPDESENKLTFSITTLVLGVILGIIGLICNPKIWFLFIVGCLGILGGIFSYIPAKKKYKQALVDYDEQLKEYDKALKELPEALAKWQKEYSEIIDKTIERAYKKQEYFGGEGYISEEVILTCLYAGIPV